MEFQTWSIIFITLHINYLQATADQKVFPSQQQANAVFIRPKRANAFFVEEILQGNLERECYEEKCNKEEAREFFENSHKTEEFWNKYYDGDQCLSNPCEHGGICKDTIGGYSCKCPEMYIGPNCETDVAECPTTGPLACKHFCVSKQESYKCVCARGYVLHSDGRSCIPQVQNPCGFIKSSSKSSTMENNDHSSKICPQGHCPWQVLFVDDDNEVICHGVLLGKKSILTTAGCINTDKDLYLVIGQADETRNASQVTKRTLHNRYVFGHPNDDLAFVELKEPIALGQDTIHLCLPDKDFSENILMKHGRQGVAVGETGSPSYLSLDDCHSKLNLTFTMTNKMFCMEGREPEGFAKRSHQPWKSCSLVSGTPVATVEGDTAFLTGLAVSQSECPQGLVFTKVSRYLPWIRQHLLSSESRVR